jgi:hypothetical protein
MPSPTEIVNYALDRVNYQPILDLDGADGQSQRCKRIYDMALLIVSGKGDWNSHEKRVSIAVDATAPINEWLYSYTLPADCIKPQKINDDSSTEYEINERKILTDAASPIILEYLAVQTNPNLWISDFLETFTSYLASRYAEAFKQDRELSATLWQEYKDNLGETTAKNGQMEPPHRPGVPTLTTNIRRY